MPAERRRQGRPFLLRRVRARPRAAPRRRARAVLRAARRARHPAGRAAARTASPGSSPLLAGGAHPARPRRLTLDVQGIHCAACVWLLRRAVPAAATAPIDLRLNPALRQGGAHLGPGAGSTCGYLAEAERFGYRFGPPQARRRARSRGLLVRLGVSAAAAMNVMIFSLCFYAGLGPRGRRALPALRPAVNLGADRASRCWSAAGCSSARRWQGLRRGVVHLDLPIALGILLAFAGSVYAHVADGPRAAYFDTVAVFVTLMLVGRLAAGAGARAQPRRLLASRGDRGPLRAPPARAARSSRCRRRRSSRGDELWWCPATSCRWRRWCCGAGGAVALDWITGESERARVSSRERSVPRAHSTPAAPRCAWRRARGSPSRACTICSGARRVAAADAPPGRPDRWWRRVGHGLRRRRARSWPPPGFLLWMPHGFEAALAGHGRDPGR